MNRIEQNYWVEFISTSPIPFVVVRGDDGMALEYHRHFADAKRIADKLESGELIVDADSGTIQPAPEQ